MQVPKEPPPVKLSDVIRAIDNATRADLIQYLGIVASLQVNRQDPNDALRNTRAQALADDLANPLQVEDFAIQFLREHAQQIAAKGGFNTTQPIETKPIQTKGVK